MKRKLFLTFLYTSKKQIGQLIWFRIKLFCFRNLNFLFPLKNKKEVANFAWDEPEEEKTFIEGNKFSFLNLTKTFNEKVEWNFPDLGKLWTFQLQSFGFLFQNGYDKSEGEKWIHEFAEHFKKEPSGYHPYSTSLRIVNWIKFLSHHQVKDKEIVYSLFNQSRKLFYSIEWHLQNNHLLENGFALLFAGVYFKDEKFFSRGKKIVQGEIEKQILPDGAHFELSPMYHQLMLRRVLDSLVLLRKEKPEEEELLSQLSLSASMMLGWMNKMQFTNGDMPLVNDSAENVAPSSEMLNRYATELNISQKINSLKESGYRKIKTPVYELLIDVGGLEPAANPGHAHTDSLSFILYANGKPFMIDTGISTYEQNEIRNYERSTSAHNTIIIENKNQSFVWGAFRIGKRAKIFDLKEGDGFIQASLLYADGFSIHTRRFEYSTTNLKILDTFYSPENKIVHGFFYVEKKFHIALAESKVNSKFASVEFEGVAEISIDEALKASEFNKREICDRIKIKFSNTLITSFTFHSI